jgi:hypothetical protein
MRMNKIRIKGVHMEFQVHTRASRCCRRQKTPQVCPEIRRIRVTQRRSLATEAIVLNAAPKTLSQSVTPAVPGGGMVMGTSQSYF